MIQSSVTYGKEDYTDVLAAEFWDLLELHRQAILPFDDIPLDPDWAVYQMLQDNNMIAIFTARHEGALIGYLHFVVSPAVFSKGIILATQEGLFVHPTYRRGMTCARLLKIADEWLEENGVSLVVQRVHKDIDYSPLLERMGYEYTDKTFTRRL